MSSAKEVSILKLSPTVLKALNCQFRGEGNENIVVSVPGLQLAFRFKKHDLNHKLNVSKESELMAYKLLFVESIIRPLFSHAYTEMPVLAELLDPQDVNYLNALLIRSREVNVHVEKLKCLIKFAKFEIYSDFAAFPLRDGLCRKSLEETFKRLELGEDMEFYNKNQLRTLTIEIKPKRAHFVQSDKRYRTCQFCTTALATWRKKCYKMCSQYCPMDLFSGKRERMVKAVNALIATPCNNFKIFSNGILIYSESHLDKDNARFILMNALSDFFQCEKTVPELRLMENFVTLLTKALLSDLTQSSCRDLDFLLDSPSITNCASYNAGVKELNDFLLKENRECDYETGNLPPNSVLGRIFKVQSLNQFGLDATYTYTTQYLSKPQEENYVVDLIRKMNKFPLNPAVAYAIAAVANDCSIFIRFRQKQPEDIDIDILEDEVGREFAVKITIGDVGPKPLEVVTKNWIRDGKVLEGALSMFRK